VQHGSALRPVRSRPPGGEATATHGGVPAAVDASRDAAGRGPLPATGRHSTPARRRRDSSRDRVLCPR